MVAWSAVTALAVAALLLSEHKESRAGVWLSKPAASCGFLAVALAAGAWESGYGRAIFCGLVLSWLGDVLLIPRAAPRVFLCGVGSFLLGHVAYAVAFLSRGLDAGVFVIAALAAAAAALATLRWLWRHVGADMKPAVVTYIVVISVMLVAALSTHTARSNAWIPIGALGFYLSDLSVARDRFVAPGFLNRAWGLPLYYAAQVILAWSIAVESALLH
jgi:uncharacterized membrane protein YhhN